MAIIKNDNITLHKLFTLITNNWKLCVLYIASFLSVSLIIAFLLPNIYKSTVVLVSNERDQNTALSALGKYRGFSDLVGVSLPSAETTKVQEGLAVLVSLDFFVEFSDKEDFLVNLFAIKKYDEESNEITYDSKIYDYDQKIWTRDVDLPLLPKPNYLEAHEEFLDMLEVSTDPANSLITISMKHRTPSLAQEWLTDLIDELNQKLKSRDVKEAKASIDFLQQQIIETTIEPVKVGLSNLIQDEISTIMLAEASPEYIFRTIDPPFLPVEKDSPPRLMIVLIGILLGIVFSFIHLLNRD